MSKSSLAVIERPFWRQLQLRYSLDSNAATRRVLLTYHILPLWSTPSPHTPFLWFIGIRSGDIGRGGGYRQLAWGRAEREQRRAGPEPGDLTRVPVSDTVWNRKVRRMQEVSSECDECIESIINSNICVAGSCGVEDGDHYLQVMSPCHSWAEASMSCLKLYTTQGLSWLQSFMIALVLWCYELVLLKI